MRIEESVEIDRPPEEVFAYVADPEHLPEWSGIVQEVRKEGQGQPQEGDRFTTVAKFLGRRFETPMEVVAHEPPRRHSDRSTGGPFEQEYTFVVEETEGGGTRLTQVAEGEPGASSDWLDRCWRLRADGSSGLTCRPSRTSWRRRAS